MRKICWRLMLPLLLLSLAACSGDDYLNAIPSESKALMSIDASRLMEENGVDGKADVLRKVLGIDNVADCGIDFSAKVFLFESPEGDLGLCAKMSSASDLQGCLVTCKVAWSGWLPRGDVSRSRNGTTAISPRSAVRGCWAIPMTL